MSYLSETGLPLVTEAEASPEVAAQYSEIKRLTHSPMIPHGLTALGSSPPALAVFVAMWSATIEHFTLPETLQSMIGFTIAEHNDCTYCAANGELMCRMLGVDEATLTNLAANLGGVSPQRIRAIMQFCVKVALQPKEVSLSDFDALRSEGVSDSEILELVVLSAFSMACDIVADTLKVPVEAEVLEALGRG